MEDTEAANTTSTTTSSTGRPTFASPLHSFSKPGASFDFGFGIEATPSPDPPPPPSVEVLLSEESPPPYWSQWWSMTPCRSTTCGCKCDLLCLPCVRGNASGTVHSPGRVSSSDVFGVKNSDLVPGKYEGGLKLWEGSLDLVKTLNSEINNGKLLLQGEYVLEGAGLIHFQDFNAEIHKSLTIPNVKVNLFKESSEGTCTSRGVGFFAGDWSEMDKLLVCGDAEHDDETPNGYDIILMAETVYALSSLPNLYKLIKKCLHYHGGVAWQGRNITLELVVAQGSFCAWLKKMASCNLSCPMMLLMDHLMLERFGNSRSNSFFQCFAMMGFQDTAGGSRTASFFHYQRLECHDDGATSSRPRWRRWLPALYGKAVSPCFLHVRKLNWSRITSALLPKKVAELSSKIRHADATMSPDICPAIVFMSPWGLPVLSRPLLARNKGRVSTYPHGRDSF